MSEILIRAAAPADLELLLRFVEAYYRHDGIEFDPSSVRRGLVALLSNEALGGAWLMTMAGREVGYFVLTFGFDLEFGGRQATVTEIYIAPEHRRKGVGRAALVFVEETLRRLGIEAYELQVECDNVAARAFYAAFGMVEHTRVPLSKRLRRRL
jgi:diamine N-acetyltransferase